VYDGMPDHLKSSVARYLYGALSASGMYGFQADVESLQRVERELRLTLNWTDGPDEALNQLLNEALSYNDELCLDLIDHQLGIGGTSARAKLAEELALALDQGGSQWQVTRSDPENSWYGLRLTRRVEPAATAAAEQAIASSGRAGLHLSDAWASAYGRHPNPSHAYSQAIKAVEIAAGAIVTPNDSAATLGRMIGEMKAHSTDFVTVLVGKGDMTAKGDVAGADIVRLGMQLLWTGQHDRHGTFDPTQPISVSQAEAESAVALAIDIVHQFTTGAIRRVSP
jgi:hypothetical protein